MDADHLKNVEYKTQIQLKLVSNYLFFTLIKKET